MRAVTVIEQIRNDFTADDIRVQGYYLYAVSYTHLTLPTKRIV